MNFYLLITFIIAKAIYAPFVSSLGANFAYYSESTILCDVQAATNIKKIANKIGAIGWDCIDNLPSTNICGTYYNTATFPDGNYSWYGITCESQVIVAVNFTNSKISGSIPTTLGLLETLTSLNFDYSGIEDKIPTTIGYLTNLIVLSIVGTSLEGTLPTALGLLSSLQYLNGSNSLLSGQIPSSLSSLNYLSTLVLSDGSFDGTIPTGSGWTALYQLDLSYNKLTGTVPSVFCESNLQYINVAGNDLSCYSECLSSVYINNYGSLMSCSTSAAKPTHRPTTRSEAPGVEGNQPIVNETKAAITQASIICDLQAATNLENVSKSYGDGAHGWDCLNGAPTTDICQTYYNNDYFPDGYHSWSGINCTSGNVIDISFTFRDIMGTISSSLGFLNTLTAIYFDGSGLYGTLPTTLGLLSNLNTLDLSNSYFTGSIPSSFGLLTSLDNLNISSSELSGILPSSLGKLTHLSYFFARDTSLRGTLPSSLGTMSSLLYFDVSYSPLTGSIPSSLAKLNSLYSLLLSNCSFSGTFPTATGWVNLYELDISSNIITGTIPPTLCQDNLNILHIDDNVGLRCYASCLSSVIYQYYGTVEPCAAVPSQLPTYKPTKVKTAMPTSVPVIYVPGMPTIVPTSASTASQNSIMCDLVAATNLQQYASGWACDSLSQPIEDVCSWRGVTCSSDAVTRISLYHDGSDDSSTADYITGTIPSSLGLLDSLQEFYVSYNSITGSLPTSLGLLTKLYYLSLTSNQITGTLPTELGNTPMIYLYLNDNEMTGSIPSSLCSHSKLEYLYAAGNSFTCYANCLTSLKTFNVPTSAVTCTNVPTTFPSASPIISSRPTLAPTRPTWKPSSRPSVPTITPTEVPSIVPTRFPSMIPTSSPTVLQSTLMCELASSLAIGVSTVKGWRCTNSLPTTALCGGWTGVTCDSGFVKKIALRYSKVSGSLPSSLGKLLSLTYLDLSGNSIAQTIPSSLGNLPFIVYLVFGSNRLTGRIPSTIGSLSLLTTLDLSYNSLSGSIPNTFGKMSRLISLTLKNNKLTGSIPISLAGTSLSLLALESNSLTGALPSTLCGKSLTAGSVTVSQNLLSCCSLCVKNSLLSSDCSSLWTCTAQPTVSPTIAPSSPTSLPSFRPTVKPTTTPSAFPSSAPTEQQGEIICDLIAATDIGTVLNWECSTMSIYCNNKSPIYSAYLACDSSSKITAISLGSVGITGTLPSVLGNMWTLTSFDLSFNCLQGTIPTYYGYLSYLQQFSLNYNNFNGTLPSTLGDMSSLVRLELPQNSFTGTIPSSLGLITSLTYLDLSVNKLIGTIPTALGFLTIITSIQLQFNKITESTVPSFLCFTTLKTLSVIGNSFVCYASCLSAKRNLQLDVRVILPYCTSTPTSQPTDSPTIVPSAPTMIPTIVPSSPTQIPTTDPTSEPTYMPTIVPSAPSFVPTINPSYLPTVSPTPAPSSAPTRAPSTVICDLSSSFSIYSVKRVGWICVDGSPISSICTWSGVKCSSNKVVQLSLSAYSASGTIPASIGDLQSLTGLDLSLNSLSGTIPSDIGKLTNLLSLTLQNNDLGGSIPESILNLVLVRTLNFNYNNLTGTIPTALGSSLTALTSLSAQENKLSGAVPSSLFESNLQSLLLSANKLSGTLPLPSLSSTELSLSAHSFDSINSSKKRQYLKTSYPKSRQLVISVGYLQLLDLSNNKLSGTLSSGLVYLTNLQTMYLGQNKLTGTISPYFGELTRLSTLSLANNNFTGVIYGSVAGVSLSLLDVSSNMLSGIVPGSLCGKSLSRLYFRNNSHLTCYATCLSSIRYQQYGDTLSCYNTTIPSSSEANSALTTQSIGLIAFGVVLFFLILLGVVLYYNKKMRKNASFAFQEKSRTIASVELLDKLLPLSNEDHILYRGKLKEKSKLEIVKVDVIVSKSRKELYEDYKKMFDLYNENGTLFVKLYGFVKEKKLSFTTNASVTGLCGIAIEQCTRTIDNDYHVIVNDEMNENEREPILGERELCICRGLINIVLAALNEKNEKNQKKEKYLLFGLNLKSIMYYDNCIKLCYCEKLLEIGQAIPELGPAGIETFYSGIVDTKVNHSDSSRSLKNCVSVAHAMWALGILLFELFVGVTLQVVLMANQSGSSVDYGSVLAQQNQSSIDLIIDTYCNGSRNFLRRKLLKLLLKVLAADRPDITKISPELYLETKPELILFFFIEQKVPEEEVFQLLRDHPEYAKVKNEDGLLPIHVALENNSYPGLIAMLIELYPESVRVRFPPSNTENLLRFALQKSLSDAHIRVLLPHYMPIDLDGNELPVEDHDYCWAKVVHYENPADHYIGTVRITLQKYHAHVKALASTVDDLGRSALNIATPLCKAEIVKILYFLGRYDFKPGVAHQSSTCVVRLAVDTLLGRDVALKFMKHKVQFYREVAVRQKGGFNSDYVLGYLEAMNSDEDLELLEELINKNLSSYHYCLVMIEADRSLQEMIAHEHVAGKDVDQIRALCTQLTKAVQHIHNRGMIHGDIKPLNIMRVDGRLVLIDLDACVSFKDGEYAGAKYSSAFIPPEMIYYNDFSRDTPLMIRTYPVDNEGHPITQHLPFELIPASPSYDLWSLGVTLFNICTGKSLFFSDNEDNIDKEALLQLYEWTDKYKSQRLSTVTNPLARNLLSQLLQKDPERRISADRTLAHPFISGKKAARMPGEVPEFDVFISYRVAADAVHVEKLYHMLVAREISVWWDKVCLEPGKPWEEGFCNGLAKCRAFIPILSREAINSILSPNRQNFANLKEDSPCDNVLLEHRLALEMRAMGLIELIFPVMIGDIVDTDYTNYFVSGCHPSCQNITVEAVEDKVREHLDRQGLGAPFSGFTAINTVLSKLLENQGAFVEGNETICFDKVTEDITAMIRKTRLKNESSSRSIVLELDEIIDEADLDDLRIQLRNFARLRSRSSRGTLLE